MGDGRGSLSRVDDALVVCDVEGEESRHNGPTEEGVLSPSDPGAAQGCWDDVARGEDDNGVDRTVASARRKRRVRNWVMRSEGGGD